jgi:hypothetical protein
MEETMGENDGPIVSSTCIFTIRGCVDSDGGDDRRSRSRLDRDPPSAFAIECAVLRDDDGEVASLGRRL